MALTTTGKRSPNRPTASSVIHDDGEDVSPSFHCRYAVLITTTVLRPFVRDYPGEPVPEETLTHPPS